MVSVEKQKNVEHVVAAGGNNTEYLDLAKKGGGHKGEWNDFSFDIHRKCRHWYKLNLGHTLILLHSSLSEYEVINERTVLFLYSSSQ